MFIFSIGGTTYGMLEETVGFYALFAAAMVMAGMDTIVSSAIVLLGAGSGVLGSTINPFAVGAAVSSLPEGVEVNQGLIIIIGIILWLSTLLISIAFVRNYAKKVIKRKGSTILSLRERKEMEMEYGGNVARKEENVKLTNKQIITLILFGLTFLVMIIAFIPWPDFGITIFDKWTAWLTGLPFGSWWFYEAAVWFLITPTCGAIMGGLALAKVEYTTWVKFAGKIVLTIVAVNIIILTLLMLVF